MPRLVTLVVEDGTIVAGANSFVTEQQIVDYAVARGVTLPFATEPEQDAVAVLGIKAMDYLWIQPWKGDLVSDTQTTPWPRKNIADPVVAEDEIPPLVIEAQLQLALLANAGTILLPTWTGTGFLIRERVGPIDNTYSEKVGVSTDGLPILPGIAGLLSAYLLGTAEGFISPAIFSVGPKHA